MLVKLEPLAQSDVGDRYLAWMRDPEVTRYLEARFSTPTKESLVAFVRRSLQDDTDKLFRICVEDDCISQYARDFQGVESGLHVGNLRIHQISKQHGTAEVGLIIGEARFRGCGLGRAALKAAEALCISDLGIRKLTAGCYASNHASRRAFGAAGYREVGTRIDQYCTADGFEDQVLMERLLEPHSSPSGQ